MEEVLYLAIGAAVIALASFVAGGFYYRYLVSEAELIKKHVSQEAEAIRGDVSAAVRAFTSKL